MSEKFVAGQSLVASEAFVPGHEPHFRWLDVPLDGYEEWLGRGGIDVSQRRSRITADYAKIPVLRWKVAGMPLELHRVLEGTAGTERNSLTWREAAFVRMGYLNADLTADLAIERVGRLEDLLVVLADCDNGVGFPTLRRTRSEPAVRFYYTRSGRTAENPAEWHKAWAKFDGISDRFGEILDAWLRKYEIHGPGFHLYLGNRRGYPMYPEHRFASMIWGLEALHRSIYPPANNPKQAAKVKRILDQIGSEKDREWARRLLPVTSEPALAARLAELFSSLPIGLGRGDFANFAERCAQRRNDVSHFGGVRVPGGYDAFLTEIVILNSAIDLLYHALLLKVVEVPDLAIHRRLIDGPHSSAARDVLKKSGIIISDASPSSTLDP